MGQAHGKSHDGGDDVKRQIGGGDETEQPLIYQLLNVKDGGGKLIDLIKESRASLSCDFTSSSRSISSKREQIESELDAKIAQCVCPLLYNNGHGKLIPLSQISLIRFGCKTDLESKYPQQAEYLSQTQESQIKIINEEQSSNHNSNEQQFQDSRLVCWKLDERGFVGETALHICFLLSTKTHMELAHRLLRLFPNLINDFYIKDEYFGESSLHMSIVNEDVTILKTLLDYGANVHQRCLGRYFVCDSQKSKLNVNEMKLAEQIESLINVRQYSQLQQITKRIFSLDWNSNTFASYSTNYEGNCYWGEYPLSFSVCLNLEHCFRLLLASGANPNSQDSNGNTPLHMAVISNRIGMFDLCYASGADIRVKNKQKLSPLTLAAKLGRTEMFFHILDIQRVVTWMFCDVCFIDIPIDEIDSIKTSDGSSVEESALSIVVFSNTNEHLEMLNGILNQMLTVKWQSTQKGKFFAMLCHFTIIFIVSIITYITRYIEQNIISKRKNVSDLQNSNINNNTIDSSHVKTIFEIPKINTFQDLSSYLDPDIINKISEGSLIILILLYLQSAFFRTLRGGQSYLDLLIKTLTLSPEMSLFVITSLFILISIPLRMYYFDSKLADDSLTAFIMFALPLKFLFFCRAFRSVGPFVIMIYKIIVNDLLCFVIIMLIFVFGFSQSFAVIFKSHSSNQLSTIRDNSNETLLIRTSNDDLSKNFFENFLDGILSMHLMALNEFGMVFDEFESTNFPTIAKGKTYQEIASQPNENLRQWARTLLMVERSWKDSDRLASLNKYSEQKTIQVYKADEAGKLHFVNIQSNFYRTTWNVNIDDKQNIESLKELTEENLKSSKKLMSMQESRRNSNRLSKTKLPSKKF